jgi:hypothetical protein
VPVAVDEAVGGAAIAVVKDDSALEDIGVVAGVFVGWLRRLDFKKRADVGDEKLVVGAFGSASITPAGEELVDLHDGGILVPNRHSDAGGRIRNPTGRTSVMAQAYCHAPAYRPLRRPKGTLRQAA